MHKSRGMLNVERSMLNVELPVLQFNIQHSTLNIQHSSSRIRMVLVLLLFAAPLLAQVKETVTVSVVEVPVTVVGRDGNPVRGLTAANFEVIDEGKKRPVTGFDAIDFTSKDVAAAISPLNPAARRSFMLVFDLGYSSPKSISRA